MNTGRRRRITVLAAAPAALAVLAALVVPASPAAAATTCGTVLAPALDASITVDGYSYSATTDSHGFVDEAPRTTVTYQRDNVHQRLRYVETGLWAGRERRTGLYADATSWSQGFDPRDPRIGLSPVNLKALALLRKSHALWFRRTTSTFRDIRVGDLPWVVQPIYGQPLISTTTGADGTTTIVCGESSVATTATVAGTGRIATLVKIWDLGTSDSRTEVQFDYRTPSVTAPSGSETVDIALLGKARTAVLLPGLIKGLARAIKASSFDVAEARGHARPTAADIRYAARDTTAAFNRGAGATRKATVVTKARGATVYAVAPITGKRTAYYVHRVGRQVVITRR